MHDFQTKLTNNFYTDPWLLKSKFSKFFRREKIEKEIKKFEFGAVVVREMITSSFATDSEPESCFFFMSGFIGFFTFCRFYYQSSNNWIRIKWLIFIIKTKRLEYWKYLRVHTNTNRFCFVFLCRRQHRYVHHGTKDSRVSERSWVKKKGDCEVGKMQIGRLLRLSRKW